MSAPVDAATVNGAILAAVLRRARFTYRDENHLQGLIGSYLHARGFETQREAVLAPGERIDLLVGRVGIEVKTKGSVSAVAAQLARYDLTGKLDDLILVTSRRTHASITHAVSMPVTVVVLPWS